jgi:pilus assembly protein CpaD
VPNSRDGDAGVRYFGERMAAMGVPRDRILVTRRNSAPGDIRIELNYITYEAHVDPCGDWSMNWADTGSNQSTPNFGCSVQNNIAAMVADPRDLVAPRAMDDASATRRAAVLGHYEKGETTAATKSSDQSGSVSSVGSAQ